MSYNGLRVGSRIRQFRQLLNQIDHELKNVESCYGMANEFQVAGHDPKYDASAHWQEFSVEARKKLLELLAIIQSETGNE